MIDMGRRYELMHEPTLAESRAERAFVGHLAVRKAEELEWSFHRREAERHSRDTVRPPAFRGASH